MDENIIIIIAMANPDDIECILDVLEGYGISEVPCYTYLALRHTVELHINDERIPKTYREELNAAKSVYKGYELGGIVELGGLSMIRDVVLDNRSVLVFQPGKVGSISVTESLEKAGIRCLHAHLISGSVEGYSGLLKERMEGIQFLHSTNNPIKIISLVRDPIGRDISMYFQPCHDEYIVRDYVQPDVYKGINDYLEKHIKIGTGGWIFEWFNMEMKEVFGIDVYQNDFDKRKGYQIIKKDNIELLLMKVEKLDDCQEAIARFVGLKDFELEKSNVAENKLYKFVYNEVKKTIEIPEYILDFYYKGNKYMDHFYSTEEKEMFANKWKRKMKIYKV